MKDTKLLNELINAIEEARTDALTHADFKIVLILESILDFIEKRRR